jgi:hypothetical protein
MVGHLATGNQEAEHSSQIFGLMFFGENLWPVGDAGSWVFHSDIFFRFKDLHRSFLLHPIDTNFVGAIHELLLLLHSE